MEIALRACGGNGVLLEFLEALVRLHTVWDYSAILQALFSS